MNLIEIYKYIKQLVIEKGFQSQIDWVQSIPPIEEMSKWYFFREYVWVVLNTGMKTEVIQKTFDTFWNNGEFNFNIIGHLKKKESIKKTYNRLDFYFNHFKNSKNKLKYLETLPFIGPITKNHLARNLGSLEYAKSDRHLVRIASFFNYPNVQSFCDIISEGSKDKSGVVDLIFWGFAKLHSNYIDLLQTLIEKEV